MANIYQFPTPIPVTNGNYPQFKFAVFGDNLAAVTAAGYLNSAYNDSAMPLSNADVVMALYSFNINNATGTFGIFTVNILTTNGQITLTEWTGTSGIVLPTVANAIAVFSNTTGTLTDNIVANNVVQNTSATPGTVRAIKGQMQSTIATMTSGNLVGVRGEVDYVSASGGFLYGTQGKLIPTGTLSGSSWNAAVFGQFDISGANINAGQTATLWGDYGATSGTITNATGMYGIAMTNTTAAVVNAQVYLYGGATYLFELNQNIGLVGASYAATAGAGTIGANPVKLKIQLDSVTKYLICADDWT